MIELIINERIAVVKEGTNIKLTSENPYFSGTTTFTYEVDLPLDIEQNRIILGHINRMDVTKQNKSWPARLLADNRTVLSGIAVLTKITDTAAKVQLLGTMAAYNYKNRMDELYIDELDLGNWYNTTWPDTAARKYAGSAYSVMYGKFFGDNVVADDSKYAQSLDLAFGGGSNLWVCYPIYNTTADIVCNDYVFREKTTGERNLRIEWHPNWHTVREEGDPAWYAMAIQPFVWLMAEKIAAATGYTLSRTDNVLYNDPFFKKIFIANANCHVQCNKCLSHWSVNEWWDQIEKTFGVVMAIDEGSNVMRMFRKREFFTAYSSREFIDDVVDEFQVDMEDETHTDISVNNVGFADYDNDPEDRLSEEVLGAAEINNSYANIGAIVTMFKNSVDKAASLKGYTGTIFRCYDGKQYIYFPDNDGNPAIKEVNQFKNRIKRSNKDTLDVEIKFVPARFIDHETLIMKKAERHPGAVSESDFYVGTVATRILARPDRADAATLGSISEITDTTVLEYLITGEEQAEDSSPEDVIYIAIASGSYRDSVTGIEGETTYQLSWPRPWLREKSIWYVNASGAVTQDPAMSLGLTFVSGVTNLYSQTMQTAAIIDTTVRYCIKFIADRIPNPGAMFVIRNKQFVCEKLEVNITPDGKDRMITGYFYEYRS